MASSPIQIVLNSSDFIELWERPPGGSSKDFYANNDKEFVEHKKKITRQLGDIRDQIASSKFTDISYAKLTLKQEALAKTHRPTKAIFKSNVAPVVGGGDLGELIIELTPEAIDKISSKIAEAEEETKWKHNQKLDKDLPNPSAVRSELGAINDIALYKASDKRSFSVEDGLSWIQNQKTGGGYIVELFEVPPARHDWDTLSKTKYDLFNSFIEGLSNFGNGLVASRIAEGTKGLVLLGIRLENTSNPSNIQISSSAPLSIKRNKIREINIDFSKHVSLLEFLEIHPLVRKISLPPILTSSNSIERKKKDGNQGYSIPTLPNNYSYPKLGIIDGGVSDVLGNWVEDRWGLLSDEDKDEEHGTFIAGLTLSGKTLNGDQICQEEDGCLIIDLDLLPREDRFSNYYTKIMEFFDELEVAVREMKGRTGVRVFNFSLNVIEHGSTFGYSAAAKILDKIAEENDVIFVISAGNTQPADFRKEWPTDPSEALGILASSRNDSIQNPAESSRNLSVSAINPPHLKGVTPYALSNYSCRGPGARVGLKPDLTHVGGAGTKTLEFGHGLNSIDINGNVVDSCGTSFAAPNVAKTIVCLDHAIEGIVSRESLIALAIHNAVIPDVLADKKFKHIFKHLVGFGKPNNSEKILEGSEHAITLVFANRVYPGKKMSFNFSWPSSLVVDGKCLGHAKLTVVSTPPLDYSYGAEFVRINVEGHLRQEQKDGSFLGQLKSIYNIENPDKNLYEKNQIDHSLKWSPIKVYEKNSPKGIGSSVNWKLEIEHLARSGETLSTNGVPFTALLTITDPSGTKPVFNDMRQTLQSLGVKVVDIQTAARVSNRI